MELNYLAIFYGICLAIVIGIGVFIKSFEKE
jgi:hypothetical protein